MTKQYTLDEVHALIETAVKSAVILKEEEKYQAALKQIKELQGAAKTHDDAVKESFCRGHRIGSSGIFTEETQKQIEELKMQLRIRKRALADNETKLKGLEGELSSLRLKWEVLLEWASDAALDKVLEIDAEEDDGDMIR